MLTLLAACITFPPFEPVGPLEVPAAMGMEVLRASAARTVFVHAVTGRDAHWVAIELGAGLDRELEPVEEELRLLRVGFAGAVAEVTPPAGLTRIDGLGPSLLNGEVVLRSGSSLYRGDASSSWDTLPAPPDLSTPALLAGPSGGLIAWEGGRVRWWDGAGWTSPTPAGTGWPGPWDDDGPLFVWPDGDGLCVGPPGSTLACLAGAGSPSDVALNGTPADFRVPVAGPEGLVLVRFEGGELRVDGASPGRGLVPTPGNPDLLAVGLPGSDAPHGPLFQVEPDGAVSQVFPDYWDFVPCACERAVDPSCGCVDLAVQSVLTASFDARQAVVTSAGTVYPDVVVAVRMFDLPEGDDPFGGRCDADCADGLVCDFDPVGTAVCVEETPGADGLAGVELSVDAGPAVDVDEVRLSVVAVDPPGATVDAAEGPSWSLRLPPLTTFEATTSDAFLEPLAATFTTGLPGSSQVVPPFRPRGGLRVGEVQDWGDVQGSAVWPLAWGEDWLLAPTRDGWVLVEPSGAAFPLQGTVVAADPGVNVWNHPIGPSLQAGRVLLSDGAALHAFDPTSWTSLGSLPGPEWVPTEARVARDAPDVLGARSWDREHLRVVDLSTGSVLHSVDATVGGFDLSPDGTRLARAAFGFLEVFDLATGTVLQSHYLPTYLGAESTVRFTADGGSVVMGDGLVRPVPDGPMCELGCGILHMAPVNGVSNDEVLLLTGGPVAFTPAGDLVYVDVNGDLVRRTGAGVETVLGTVGSVTGFQHGAVLLLLDGSGVLHRVDPETGLDLSAHAGPYDTLTRLRDGTVLAAPACPQFGACEGLWLPVDAHPEAVTGLQAHRFGPDRDRGLAFDGTRVDVVTVDADGVELARRTAASTTGYPVHPLFQGFEGLTAPCGLYAVDGFAYCVR
ncbi:MAG: hypothetical protein H6734_23925 [Alphaproteobacteria bacterium]|nr:hypothetical protein [Alphaproteobacteria bacterium]